MTYDTSSPPGSSIATDRGVPMKPLNRLISYIVGHVTLVALFSWPLRIVHSPKRISTTGRQ